MKLSEGAEKIAGEVSQLSGYGAVVPPTPSHTSSGTGDGQSRHAPSNLAFPSESSALSRNGETRSGITEDPYATSNVSSSFRPPVRDEVPAPTPRGVLFPRNGETEASERALNGGLADAGEDTCQGYVFVVFYEENLFNGISQTLLSKLRQRIQLC